MTVFIILNTVLIIFILTYPLFEILRWRNHFPENNHFESENDFAATVILSVYNEERNLERKIHELMEEAFWGNSNSEIIVISGGSSDKTNQILEKYQNNNKIRLKLIEEQIQKVESLNIGIYEAKNEILVFSDCRQIMSKGAIDYLCRPLLQNKCNLSAATLVNRDEDFQFRKYINQMNLRKSYNANSMNVYGALYAARKSQMPIFPKDILFDDLYVLAFYLSQHKIVKQIEEAKITDTLFQNYYRRDRILRLTRGLLLFLTRHFGLIRKMRRNDRFHFLMSKYAKLALPISLLSLILPSIFYLGISEFLFEWFLLLFLGVFFFFVNKKVRLFIEFVWFTFIAILLYLTNMNRSVRWNKFTNY